MLSDLAVKQKRLVLTGLMLGMLLSALTSTIVSTAMPRIIATLGGMEYLSWALTAYMISSTVAMPIAGKLSDMFGRKPFYIGGIIIFLIGNILCGTSESITQFIIFRAIAGIGGGVMQANAMTIIADLYPPAKRGKYQGLIGGVFGIASVIGPVMGGYITDHWNWSWVFWVNIPLGLIALLVLSHALPKTSSGLKRSSIDYPGALLLIGAFTPMLISFTWAGSKYSWLSFPVISLLLVSLAALIVFRWVEKRAEEPIVPLSLFKNAAYNISVITAFLMSVAMFGTLMYMPMFIQGVMGFSAADSGIAIVPMMGGLIVASVASGQVVSRTGKYRVLAIGGFILMTIAMILLSRMNEHIGTPQLVFNMILFGLGLGTALPIFVVIVQSAFPHSQVGIVTSGLQFFRSIGGTFGVALMGSVLNKRFRDASLEVIPMETRNKLSDAQLHLFNTPQALFNENAVELLTSNVDPQTAAGIMEAVGQLRAVLADAFHSVFLLGIVIIAAALVMSFFLKEIPLRHSNESATDQAGMEMAADATAVPGVMIPPEGQPDIYQENSPSSRVHRSTRSSHPQESPK